MPEFSFTTVAAARNGSKFEENGRLMICVHGRFCSKIWQFGVGCTTQRERRYSRIPDQSHQHDHIINR